MNPWLKLVVALIAAAGFSFFVVVAWFAWLLITSLSEDGFGQEHQEQWAVASCWRDVRDGSICDINQFSEYAQAQFGFFTEQLAAHAATTTCNLSRSHLAYARTSSPGSMRLLTQLQEEVKADCSHSDVSR